MERFNRTRWALKWCSFFTSVALFAVGSTETDPCNPACESQSENTSPANDEATFQKSCVTPDYSNRYLMLVSTMDGKVSALNMDKEGRLEWSINTGTGGMLSSSISKLEINRDGRKARLIPSLDGGLYQFDGQSIEPVPFNADTLLSSSFKINDNSIVVGGKEAETYGIDAKSGRVKYVCDMNGCKLFKNEKPIKDSDETLVISRNTKTVRAVEMSSGGEKWNFSVGQHEIEYIIKETNQPKQAISDESRNLYYDHEYHDHNGRKEDIDFQDCFEDFVEDDSLFNFPWWSENDHVHPKDMELKIIVPKGIVVAVPKGNPELVLWQHKFPTPIAHAWTLINGKLKQLDMFDTKYIPALNLDHEMTTVSPDQEDIFPETPALYIGSHENQMYVQPSVQMLQAVEEGLNNAVKTSERYVNMPSVTWKPYMATATSRTPAEINHPLQLGWEDGDREGRSVAIWREYPYDVGYYLFPDYSPMKLNPNSGNNGSDDSEGDFYFEMPMLTLMHWWKEVLVITLFSTVVLNVIIMKVIRPRMYPATKVEETENRANVEITTPKSTEENVAVSPETTSNNEDKKEDYQSRYYTDFEQISCLGKGGFGVVFHTRNRLDDCDYAVKRITLQDSEKAREKVIREVKALAKLDHAGIVRFFQAWLETPPPGWQEEKDRIELQDVSFSPTPGYIITEYTPSPKENSPQASQQKGNKKRKEENIEKDSKQNVATGVNPFKPFGDGDLLQDNCYEQTTNTEMSLESTSDSHFIFSDNADPQFKRNGSTEPFVPHNFDIEDDFTSQSDSSSFNNTYHKKEVAFYLNSSSCRNRNPKIPFQKYYQKSSLQHSNLLDERPSTIHRFDKSEQSFEVVFEDSGCSEKDFEESAHDHGHAVININTSEDLNTETDFGSEDDNLPQLFKIKTSSSKERPATLSLINEKEQKKRDKKSQPKLYLYIQMQLCKKESLKEWLASNTLNRDRSTSLDIFDQIVSAMDYVHESGLMHRDLKPSNIFFSMDGSIKIGDFGLVTALEESSNISGDGDLARTPASVYFSKHTDQVGTKLYMSLEQIEGRNYTHKVDIYAMGLIFFELFYPFATQMERVKTLLEVKRHMFPTRFQRELPDECEFVKKLLSPHPEQRPSTKDILNHNLLQEFQRAREILSRIRSASKTRTFSQSSGKEQSFSSGSTDS